MDKTLEFFKKAIPNVTDKNKSTQLGVHFEEIGEMLDSLSTNDPKANMILMLAKNAMKAVSIYLKENENAFIVTQDNRESFLDSLCDQLVTTIGLGYMHNMNIKDGFEEVNNSNLSKFDENGNPVLDSNMKIIKSSNYFKPNLKPFI